MRYFFIVLRILFLGGQSAAPAIMTNAEENTFFLNKFQRMLGSNVGSHIEPLGPKIQKFPLVYAMGFGVIAGVAIYIIYKKCFDNTQQKNSD